jgi:hypothetical protein
VDTAENRPIIIEREAVTEIMMWLPKQLLELVSVFKKETELLIFFSREQG